jgi:hypothetical protein
MQPECESHRQRFLDCSRSGIEMSRICAEVSWLADRVRTPDPANIHRLTALFRETSVRGMPLP